MTLGPERQERDEDRTEDEPRKASEASDDDPHQQKDRERDREGVRVDEGARDREQAAGDARVCRTDPEREVL